MGKEWKQCQTLFLGGSKITADGDCSHEIKRRLLLGRKDMIRLYQKIFLWHAVSGSQWVWLRKHIYVLYEIVFHDHNIVWVSCSQDAVKISFSSHVPLKTSILSFKILPEENEYGWIEGLVLPFTHHGFAFRTWEQRGKRKGSMIPFAGAGRHLYLQATIYLWMKDCGAFTRG